VGMPLEADLMPVGMPDLREDRVEVYEDASRNWVAKLAIPQQPGEIHQDICPEPRDRLVREPDRFLCSGSQKCCPLEVEVREVVHDLIGEPVHGLDQDHVAVQPL
jgi:hypothetical protein